MKKHGNTKKRVMIDIDKLFSRYLKRTMGKGNRPGMIKWLSDWLNVSTKTIRNYYSVGFPVEDARVIANVLGTMVLLLKRGKK